jgi:hypothetical protein
MNRGRKRGLRLRVVTVTAPAPANMDIPQPETPPITTAKTSMADTAFLRLASVEASDANTSSVSDIR